MKKKITVTSACPVCKKERSVTVNKADYERWERGECVQYAFPYLSDDEREMFVTGICAECWDRMTDDGEEEEMTEWETNARIVEEYYGGFVNWEERFYNCPECGEPIYECDWTEDELSVLCPVCVYDGEDDDYEEDDLEVGFNPYMGCYDGDC